MKLILLVAVLYALYRIVEDVSAIEGHVAETKENILGGALLDFWDSLKGIFKPRTMG